MGSPEVACQLFAFVDEWRRAPNRERDPLWSLTRVHGDLADELRRRLNEDLDPDDYVAAMETGSRMGLDDAVALARDQLGL